MCVSLLVYSLSLIDKYCVKTESADFGSDLVSAHRLAVHLSQRSKVLWALICEPYTVDFVRYWQSTICTMNAEVQFQLMTDKYAR